MSTRPMYASALFQVASPCNPLRVYYRTYQYSNSVAGVVLCTACPALVFVPPQPMQQRRHYVLPFLSQLLSRDIGISFASQEYGTDFDKI